MDQNFRKRVQKTLHCGELESEQCPFALTELAVEYFNGLAPHKLGHVDLQSASNITSQDSVSPSSVAMSMMYAKRLHRKRPDYLKKLSSSDLFIISMMMASKYLYDEGVDEEVFNDEWAENAGVDKEEINNMELDFLDALDWELFIKEHDFDRAMLSIEKNIALTEGLKRGWFTYTDLCLLLDDPFMQSSMSDVGLEWLKVVLVNTAAYFAGVLIMVGSTVLVTNASLTLASSGMMPLLMPGFRTTVSFFPGLAPALLPVDGPPGYQPTLSDPGFSANETRDEGEKEEEEAGLVSGDEGHPELPGDSVVDTILSQLMAVLTLKSHLVQFVSAVSDGYASGKDRNRSSSKLLQHNACNVESEVEADGMVKEESSVDAVFSLWLEKGALSGELNHAVWSCPCCRKSTLHTGLFSNVMWSGAGASLCHANQHLENLLVQHGFDQNEWTQVTKGWVCADQCQRYKQQLQGCSKELSQTVAVTGMDSLFPDITIGFSTSMPPPVYAT